MRIKFETVVLPCAAPEEDSSLRTMLAVNYCLDHGLDIAQEYIGSCRELLVCDDRHYSLKIELLSGKEPSVSDYDVCCVYAAYFRESDRIEGALITLRRVLEDLDGEEDLPEEASDEVPEGSDGGEEGALRGGVVDFVKRGDDTMDQSFTELLEELRDEIPFQGSHETIGQHLQKTGELKILRRMCWSESGDRGFSIVDKDGVAVRCETLLRFRFRSDGREYVLFSREDQQEPSCGSGQAAYLNEVFFLRGQYYLSRLEEPWDERIGDVIMQQLGETDPEHPEIEEQEYDLIY